mgnify:CR=1 FL=1
MWIYLLLFGSNIETEIQITNDNMISGINLFAVRSPFEYWAQDTIETKKNKKITRGILPTLFFDNRSVAARYKIIAWGRARTKVITEVQRINR